MNGHHFFHVLNATIKEHDRDSRLSVLIFSIGSNFSWATFSWSNGRILIFFVEVNYRGMYSNE